MNRINTSIAAILVGVFFVGLCGSCTARAQATATGNSDLVSQLTSQLNITPQQATGGAGAIFGLAKTRLSPEQFSKIAAAVPGMNGLLHAAPRTPTAGTPSATSGSAVGSLSSLGSAVPGNAGGLASLATSFHSLGLSPGMAGKFVPVLQQYVGAKGGSNTAAMFAGALK
jgi:Protein of unknown function VcgC/VcgE (DUF2780)